MDKCRKKGVPVYVDNTIYCVCVCVQQNYLKNIEES